MDKLVAISKTFHSSVTFLQWLLPYLNIPCNFFTFFVCIFYPLETVYFIIKLDLTFKNMFGNFWTRDCSLVWQKAKWLLVTPNPSFSNQKLQYNVYYLIFSRKYDKLISNFVPRRYFTLLFYWLSYSCFNALLI